MGTIIRRTERRPVPTSAERVSKGGRPIARWRSRGKLRAAPIETGADGAEYVTVENAVYSARYRDHTGRLVERSTGCRDETAARQKLAGWEREAEQVRAGVLNAADVEVARGGRDRPARRSLRPVAGRLGRDGGLPRQRPAGRPAAGRRVGRRHGPRPAAGQDRALARRRRRGRHGGAHAELLPGRGRPLRQLAARLRPAGRPRPRPAAQGRREGGPQAEAAGTHRGRVRPATLGRRPPPAARSTTPAPCGAAPTRGADWPT